MPLTWRGNVTHSPQSASRNPPCQPSSALGRQSNIVGPSVPALMHEPVAASVNKVSNHRSDQQATGGGNGRSRTKGPPTRRVCNEFTDHGLTFSSYAGADRLQSSCYGSDAQDSGSRQVSEGVVGMFISPPKMLPRLRTPWACRTPEEWLENRRKVLDVSKASFPQARSTSLSQSHQKRLGIGVV